MDSAWGRADREEVRFNFMRKGASCTLSTMIDKTEGPLTPANTTTAALHPGSQGGKLKSPEAPTQGHTVTEGDKRLKKISAILGGPHETPSLHKSLGRDIFFLV